MSGLIYSSDESAPSGARRYNSFLLFALLALSLLVILVWQLIIGIQARNNGQRLREQQNKMVEQSHQVQTGLEKLARELIEVSKTDDDAKAIVAKYGISVAAPAAPVTASPAAAPSP